MSWKFFQYCQMTFTCKWHFPAYKMLISVIEMHVKKSCQFSRTIKQDRKSGNLMKKPIIFLTFVRVMHKYYLVLLTNGLDFSETV